MLQLFNTDRHWELLARNDAFWSVATFDRFRRENLNDESRAEFFRTGEEHIERLFGVIRQRLKSDFAPERSLDFGCGVGRLLMPMAKRSVEAVGVDISQTMLNEAKLQLEENLVTNARLIAGDDRLANVEGPFDFVHSMIVFQHIPPQRGEELFRELIKRMRVGAVGAIHFVYANLGEPYRPTLRTRWRRFRHRLRCGIRALRGDPQMQMNDYSMNILFRIMQEQGVTRSFVELWDHQIYYGVMLIFVKDRETAV